MKQATFANFVMSEDAHTSNFINLVCDFPEYITNTGNPYLWSEEQKNAFIKRVYDKSPYRFKQYGYYILKNKLYWSPK